jgi:hypothetical protein
MVEPTNRWRPVTDEYKAMAAQPVDAEAERTKRLEELREAKAKEVPTKKEVPVGITVLTWYFFVRAGVCAVLFYVLSAYPQSGTSNWLEENLGNFLRLPASSAKQMAEQRKQFEKEAEEQGYQMAIDPAEEKELEEREAATARNMIMAYLALSAVAGAVVGFMWLNRSWKIRWVTMCYAGAFVAKAGVNYFAGLASGLGSQVAPGETALLLFTIALNGCIFCYMAFWPGVKKLFEE